MKNNLVLFRENHRVGGTTWLSLDRSTVWEENLRPKYLKRKGIKDTCSLTDKQTKIIYSHSYDWIKWLFRTKQWNVCLACLLLELWKLCYTTLFATKQLVVYSECNINANILFNKDMYVKYNNKRKVISVTLISNQMACNDRLFGDGLTTDK